MAYPFGTAHKWDDSQSQYLLSPLFVSEDNYHSYLFCDEYMTCIISHQTAMAYSCLNIHLDTICDVLVGVFLFHMVNK